MSSFLEILAKYKSTISAMEWAAFAHDLDKSDECFLDKPIWHTQADVPVVNREALKREWWQKHAGPDTEIANPDLDFSQIFVPDPEVSLCTDSFGRLSDPFIFHHRGSHNKKEECNDTPIQLSLAAYIVHGGGGGADGIDSAIDKVVGKDNIPGIDKQTERPFRIATPFRKKSGSWDNSKLSEVISVWNRGGSIRECQPVLSVMLGETRIPFNDVTLYDHCFHVAAFTKAITAKILLEYHSGLRDHADGKYHLPKRPDRKEKNIEPPYLDYLKLEFDLAFLFARSHTSGDLRGSHAELESIMAEVRDEIESNLLFGNQFYQDHYRQLYVIPRLREPLESEWQTEIRNAITAIIERILTKYHLEELPFSISFNTHDDDSQTMDIALLNYTTQLLNPASTKKDGSISNSGLCQSTNLLQTLKPSGSGRRICDVCGIRFADHTEGDNHDHLCPVCDARRKFGEKIPVEGMEQSSMDTLIRSTENKLAYFSCRIDLSKLRNGSMWGSEKDAPQASPGRLARSYLTIEQFFANFLSTDVARLADHGYFKILLSRERLDFVVSATKADSILRALSAAWKDEFGSFADSLSPKILLVFFYRKFPFYVVWDASVRMERFLPFKQWDFLLLDSPSDRFIFGKNERKHHILPKAPVRTIADIDRYHAVWECLTKLPKSQISNIEGALVEKILSWKRIKGTSSILDHDPAFAKICELFLFAPNAFGDPKYKITPEDGELLLESAASGELLDVIDLYIHIENNKNS